MGTCQARGFRRSLKDRVRVRCLDPKARECNFLEVSYGYNEDEAKAEADRCLKCGICSECYQCVEACLAGAVDHTQKPELKEIRVGSVILSSGAKPYDPTPLENLYLYKKNPNVMTSLEFERILSASGPTMGHLVRPSDHKEPKKDRMAPVCGIKRHQQVRQHLLFIGLLHVCHQGCHDCQGAFRRQP
jgi:hypothetical protein